jgi:hypothetical protein
MIPSSGGARAAAIPRRASRRDKKANQASVQRGKNNVNSNKNRGGGQKTFVISEKREELIFFYFPKMGKTNHCGRKPTDSSVVPLGIYAVEPKQSCGSSETDGHMPNRFDPHHPSEFSSKFLLLSLSLSLSLSSARFLCKCSI